MEHLSIKLNYFYILLFISGDNKKITEFNNGIINVINPFEKYFIFPGIDGNFAFITILNRSNSVKAKVRKF